MDKTTIYIFLAVLVLAALLYFGLRGKKKETYSNLGDLDNVGTFTNPPSYEFVQSDKGLLGQLEPKPDDYFANIVAPTDGAGAGAAGASPTKPDATAMQRLTQLQGSELMPRISTNVTPFNVDVSDPATYSFAVSMPRVQLKNRYMDGSATGAIRGDVPITYHPEIPIVSRLLSQSADSLNMHGLFTPYFKSKYQKLTGAGYKNLPLAVANQEVLMS